MTDPFWIDSNTIAVPIRAEGADGTTGDGTQELHPGDKAWGLWSKYLEDTLGQPRPKAS